MARLICSELTSTSWTSSAFSRAGLRFSRPRERNCMVAMNHCWASRRSVGALRSLAWSVSRFEEAMYWSSWVCTSLRVASPGFISKAVSSAPALSESLRIEDT